MKELQDYIELLRSGEGGNTRAVPGKSAPPPGRSVAELERVVAAMRKVVERLQSENEALRKSKSSNSPMPYCNSGLSLAQTLRGPKEKSSTY